MGISRADLARELNLDESMISRLCNGQRRPSVKTIYHIARLFSVDSGKLIAAYVEGPRKFAELFNKLIVEYQPQVVKETNHET